MGGGALRKASKAFISCQENTKFKANTQVFALWALRQTAQLGTMSAGLQVQKRGTEI